MELSVSDQSLLIFVDDTGHEALVPGHPIYGLGGCAIMAADLERVIRHPWREVRRQIRGSADTPLHAAALGHPPRREDIEVVAGFFWNQPFARAPVLTPPQPKFCYTPQGIAAVSSRGLVRRRFTVEHGMPMAGDSERSAAAFDRV
jgi:hypothetical protein